MIPIPDDVLIRIEKIYEKFDGTFLSFLICLSLLNAHKVEGMKILEYDKVNIYLL